MADETEMRPPNEQDKKFSKEQLDEAVQHAISRRDIKEIKDGMALLQKEFAMLNINLAEKFVSKETFESFLKQVFSPIQKIVYGGVTLVLTAFLGAVIVLVINAK